MYPLVLSAALLVVPAMLGQNNREQQPAEPAQAAQQSQAKPSPEKASSESSSATQVAQNPGKAGEPAQTRGEADKTANRAEDLSPEARLSSEAMASFQSQMRVLQEQADEFDARARATQDALRSIKDQMAEQGLDLRLDVREAESRMNYLLSKTHEDILHGDAFGAEADLKMAAYAADFIERFLGR